MRRFCLHPRHLSSHSLDGSFRALHRWEVPQHHRQDGLVVTPIRHEHVDLRLVSVTCFGGKICQGCNRTRSPTAGCCGFSPAITTFRLLCVSAVPSVSLHPSLVLVFFPPLHTYLPIFIHVGKGLPCKLIFFLKFSLFYFLFFERARKINTHCSPCERWQGWEQRETETPH